MQDLNKFIDSKIEKAGAMLEEVRNNAPMPFNMNNIQFFPNKYYYLLGGLRSLEAIKKELSNEQTK